MEIVDKIVNSIGVLNEEDGKSETLQLNKSETWLDGVIRLEIYKRKKYISFRKFSYMRISNSQARDIIDIKKWMYEFDKTTSIKSKYGYLEQIELGFEEHLYRHELERKYMGKIKAIRKYLVIATLQKPVNNIILHWRKYLYRLPEKDKKAEWLDWQEKNIIKPPAKKPSWRILMEMIDSKRENYDEESEEYAGLSSLLFWIEEYYRIESKGEKESCLKEVVKLQYELKDLLKKSRQSEIRKWVEAAYKSLLAPTPLRRVHRDYSFL